MNKIHQPSAEKTELALLSPERAQKLDLLIHLVTNLTESLVVCGPSGIGKTTLLDELKKCDKGVLPIFNIDASPSLNFEDFQESLAKLLVKKLNLNVENKNITTVLTELSRKNRQVVIIIDNAGQLVAGLMGTLIDYASHNLGIRLIFALNRDELYVIKEFDHRVDECHFIDIPALTEEQCGAFLQALSSQAELELPLESINARLIEKIYIETHGIPGKIIAEVVKGHDRHSVGLIQRYRWFGIIAAMAILLGGFFIFKKPAPSKVEAVPNLPFVENKTEEFEVIEMKPRVKVLEEKIAQSQTLEGKNYFEAESTTRSVGEKFSANSDQYADEIKKNKAVDKLKNKNKSAEIKTPTFTKAKESKRKVVKFSGTRKDNSEWVLNQPKAYYTIQLAVLSKKSAVDSFFKQYPNLRHGLKFFRKGNQAIEQYVVIYGSFKEAKGASLKVTSLPAQYRKSWVRSFSSLHKIINK